MARPRSSTALTRLPFDLEDRYAREMGYRGREDERPARASRDKDRHRDPVVQHLRDMQAAASEVDWPKAMVGTVALAAAGWFLWRHFAGKAGATPQPDSGTIDPTPGIVDPFKPVPGKAPSSPTAAAVRVGDLILVRGDFLRTQLSGATLGGLPLVQMRVTSVAASSVIAIVEDPRIAGGTSFSVAPLVVPHSEIDSVSKPGDRGPAPPSGPVFLDGPELPVRTGKRYRARLELSTFEAMAASPDLVAQNFATLGFENVQAMHKPSELPADWPSSERTASGTTWFVQGDWRKAEQTFPRPPQAKRVWEG